MRKTHRTWPRLLVALFVCLVAATRPSGAAGAAAAGATLKLASPFGDDMVLQRDAKLCVWGDAAAGAEVRVAIAGQDTTAKADADGHWKAYLEPLPAGGPHQLEVRSGDATVTVNRVLVGDVWLCSGQSNMAMGLRECDGGAEEAKHAADRFPRLRLCMVAKGANAKTQSTADIKWRPASNESARDFSGVAFFFAGELLKDPALADVAIGVIDSSYGGTMCEAWIPPDLLSAFDANQLRPSLFGHGPAYLYNAMIAPLGPTALKGVVWYQGESNADRPEQYVRLLPTMMSGWRRQFDEPSLPFVIVQLPDWAFRSGNLQWSWIREAQEKAVRATPGAMLATAINTTDGFNLHPKEKREVGRRAALVARHDVYKEGVVARGPVLKETKFDGSTVRVTFDTASNGLSSTLGGNAVHGFALAGADGHYRFADATIDGDAVGVQCKDVPEPKNVRYAWAGVPRSTLTNRSGLPALPFRTDDLPPTADVEVQRQPSDRRLVTSTYEITIDCYGRVSSLGVRGKQFLSNGLGADGGTSIPGFFGPRPLYQITEVGPDVVSFGDTQVTLTLAFKDDAMAWTLTNAQKDDITFRIVLAPLVNVPAIKKDEVLKLSRGKTTLLVDGIDAVGESEEGKVLQVTVKGNADKKITFTVPPQQ